MRLAVTLADPTLDRLAAIQHPANVMSQVDVVDIARDIGQRSAAIARDEIKDGAHRRGEAADDEVAIEEDRGDLRALEDIFKIAVCLIQRFDLFAELRIDGIQLLIDRLLFFLRGLQLLVDRLYLLVNRDQPLIS